MASKLPVRFFFLGMSQLKLLFVLCFMLSHLASGRLLISKGTDCNTCVSDTTNYKAVCQSKYGFGASYCCSEAEMTSDSNCREAPLCNDVINVMNMKYITCPHEKYPCGISTPDLRMNLGQDLTIKVQKLMGPEDTCYYKLSAKDQVALEDLDPYNRKHLQILVKTVSGLDVYVATAQNASMLEELSVKTVSAANLNFTQNISQPMWLVMRPQSGAKRSDIKAEIQFRYYEYDPQCAEFNFWNGTACVPDYDLYCSSLTEQYRNLTGNPNTTVTYNGTNCVARTINYEVKEQVEYIYINVTNNQTVTEVVNRTFDEMFQEALNEGIPKEQIGVMAMGGSVVLGLFMYVGVDWLFEKQKKGMRRKVRQTPNSTTPKMHDMSVDEQKLNEEIRAINQDYVDEEEEVEGEDTSKPRRRTVGFLKTRKDFQVDHTGLFSEDWANSFTTLASKKGGIAVQKYGGSLPPISHRNGRKSNITDSMDTFEKTADPIDTVKLKDNLTVKSGRSGRSRISSTMSVNVANKRRRKRKHRKAKFSTIMQDYEARVKGENQFGEIEDEAFTNGVQSETHQSQPDFDQNFKYVPQERKQAEEDLSDDYDDEVAEDDEYEYDDEDEVEPSYQVKERDVRDSQVEILEVESKPTEDFDAQMARIEREAANVDGGDDDEPSFPPKAL